MIRGAATIVLTSSSDIEHTRILVAPRSAMIRSQAASSGSWPRSRARSSIVLPAFGGGGVGMRVVVDRLSGLCGRRVGDADVGPGFEPAEIREADLSELLTDAGAGIGIGEARQHCVHPALVDPGRQ